MPVDTMPVTHFKMIHSKSTFTYLKATLNRLVDEPGVGMPITGPAVVEIFNSPTLSAVASSRYFNGAKDLVTLPGIDVMSGHVNPVAGGDNGSWSALVFKNYSNSYVAASSALTALSQTPFTHAKLNGDSLSLASTGVVRVASLDGVTVQTSTQEALPEVSTDVFINWLFYSSDVGITTLRGSHGTVMTYFRERTPVTVIPQNRSTNERQK